LARLARRERAPLVVADLDGAAPDRLAARPVAGLDLSLAVRGGGRGLGQAVPLLDVEAVGAPPGLEDLDRHRGAAAAALAERAEVEPLAIGMVQEVEVHGRDPR